MKTSTARWGLIALIVATGVLQFSLAKRYSLWADEFFSLAIATGHSLEHRAAIAQPQLGDFVEPKGAVPAVEFRRYLQHESPPVGPGRVIRAVLLSDTSPPLYYLLLYGWTLLCGTGDMALRLFSVSWSLLSLPLVAIIARRVAGACAAAISCVLFAFSPLVIYYSTEGRMYSLLIFLALVTTSLSLLLQGRGARLSYCSLWIVVSLAGFLTHYFFIFPWLANVAYLFLQPAKFQRRWLLLCTCITGVAFFPWMWIAAGYFGNWRVTQDWLHWKPAGFNRAQAMLAQLLRFFSAEGHGLWRTPRWSTLLALAAFAIVAGIALFRSRWKFLSGQRLLLWLWFLAGSFGPSVIDLLQHTYTSDIPRYALSGLPAACLLAGIGLSYVERLPRIVLLCLVLLAWFPGVKSIYHQHARSSEPVRDIAKTISATATSSDLILVHSIPSGVLGISRYVRTPAAIASWVGQLGNRRVPESLQTLAQGRSRILLIKIHEVGAPAPEEDWLRANATVVREERMQVARLIEFQPRNAQTF